MKYAIHYQGGIGDALLAFLRPGGDAGYVANLKRGEPDAFVRCAVMTTTPEMSEIFCHVPQFDEVVYRPWDGEGGRFRADAMRDHFAVPRDGAWSQPEVPLTPAERLLADELESGGPFVALHPFAGTSNRSWEGSQVNPAAIVGAIAASGMRVLVLGGSSSRREGRGAVRVVERPELFDVEMPRAVSLVNRASIRLQAYLASRAARFVGTFSCFHCVALARGIPAFLVAPAELRPFFALEHPAYGRLDARSGSRIEYFGADTLEERIVEWMQ